MSNHVFLYACLSLCTPFLHNAAPLHFYACHALPLQHVAHLRPYVAEPSLSVAFLSQASPLLSRAKLRHNFAVVAKQSFATAFFSLPTLPPQTLQGFSFPQPRILCFSAATPSALFFAFALQSMPFRRRSQQLSAFARPCFASPCRRDTQPPGAVAVQSNSQLCRCFSSLIQATPLLFCM